MTLKTYICRTPISHNGKHYEIGKPIKLSEDAVNALPAGAVAEQGDDAKRLAAEQAQRQEAERLVAEEAQRQEAERLAAEEAQRLEAERLAAEQDAKKNTATGEDGKTGAATEGNTTTPAAKPAAGGRGGSTRKAGK
jgi:hypothetical protein